MLLLHLAEAHQSFAALKTSQLTPPVAEYDSPLFHVLNTRSCRFSLKFGSGLYNSQTTFIVLFSCTKEKEKSFSANTWPCQEVT